MLELTPPEGNFIALCIEWFLYGKISVLCALTCTLAKEVQSLPGLGLYSGIFPMYLQNPQNKLRKESITFYTLCVLYVLSTVNVVIDFVDIIIKLVSNNLICKNIIF